MTATRTLPVSWGLATLDHALGPMIPGRLCLIGARPSCGKTAFVNNVVCKHLIRCMDQADFDAKIETPKRILLFMTERSPQVTKWCMAAMMAELPEDDVLHEAWEDMPPWARERFQQKLDLVETWEDMGWLRMPDIGSPTVRKAYKIVEAEDPDIVIFDHLQRVRPDDRESPFDAIRRAADMFQHLAAREGRIPLVCSQLKRRGDGIFDKYQPPFLEDFYGSGMIEADANIAFGLFRPLRKGLTTAIEKEIRAGREDLGPWKEYNTMGLKILKHTFRPDAADKVYRFEIERGRISDGLETPF